MNYGATLQFASAARFVVCLVVQKLIFNEGSSVGMCSIKVQMRSKAQTAKGLCRVDDATLSAINRALQACD